LEVDLKAGTIWDMTNGNQLKFSPIPEIMLHILNEGGLLPYIQKHGGFKL
jgi:3-isopropylmalate/(R)-2-methylmalate dehydratase small subunit